MKKIISGKIRDVYQVSEKTRYATAGSQAKRNIEQEPIFASLCVMHFLLQNTKRVAAD